MTNHGKDSTTNLHHINYYEALSESSDGIIAPFFFVISGNFFSYGILKLKRYFTYFRLCGGTIIGPYEVITAAHCISFHGRVLDARQIDVRTGTTF